jgi:hypothetical protein
MYHNPITTDLKERSRGTSDQGIFPAALPVELRVPKLPTGFEPVTNCSDEVALVFTTD